MKSINLRTLDLNLLRMMIAISDTKSVSKAGECLGLSQPAASNALGRLRKTFDDPLFIRGKDGMSQTSLAKTILPGVRTSLEGLYAVLGDEEGFNPTTSNRTFRVSMSGFGEASFLPSLAQRVFSAGKGMRLFNATSPVSELTRSLENCDADIAIGMFDLNERGIKSKLLFQDSYVVIAGEGVMACPTSIQDMKSSRIIISAPAATYAKNMENMITRNGLVDNVFLRVGHFGALPELLKKLDVVAIVPSGVGKALEAIGLAKTLEIELKQMPGQVRLIWHDSTTSDASCQWLRSQVLELFGEEASSQNQNQF